MGRFAQVGIAVGMLGTMLTLMGLFPGMTGIQPTQAIGIVQIATIIAGLSFLILGALGYVKFTFYARKQATLTQQIGVRLALTGLVFAAISGLADALGFGSNIRELGEDIIIGPLQAIGVLGSFAVASLGVIIYALAGDPEPTNDM